MKNQLTCRSYIQQPDGSLTAVDDLTEEERAAFGERIAQRMGKTLNEFFSVHPEEYTKI